MSNIIGWDIGGAHLKAVLLHEGMATAIQIPCELWRGLDRLEAAFSKAFELFNLDKNAAQHAVTMTGELVDLFENRAQGVREISNLCAKLLGKETYFYAANAKFVELAGVSALWQQIASANWHCSASLLAKHISNALFVDIGSTTTDVIPIVNGKVVLDASTDAQRMASDSLVYTGVTRTPLMALAQKLPFDGTTTNVAAEYFATMADVYRLTGDLQAQYDVAETADGKGKTALESARRLARMIGHDVENHPIATWKTLAEMCKKLQIQQIKLAVLKHLKPDTPLISAGSGAFLVAEIASELNVEYVPISQVLSIVLDDNLAVCFPAYAAARLLQAC